MAEVVKAKRFGNTKGKSVEVEGKEFKSYAEACRHYKVSEMTFHSRKSRGYSIEQCLGLEDVPDKRFGNTKNRGKQYRGKPVEIEGKKFKSRKEACKYYNVNVATFQWRKRKGWTIEQCLGLK